MEGRDERRTVLVVDDAADMVEVIAGILRSEFRVKAARNGEGALRIASENPAPDLILLDVVMPGMDEYQVCRSLKADPLTRRIPVLFLTSRDQVEDEKKGLELGAVDYIAKPVSPPILMARVRSHLALADQRRDLEQMVNDRTRELQQTRLEVIRQLSRAAEFRDNETGLHVTRMSQYAHILAKVRVTDARWADLILAAAPMHDIGKIGIPDGILLKNGPLTPQEFDFIKKHPEMGAAILGENDSDLMKMAREISLSHHEKWDGNGYPHQLKGEAIPLSGRIAAVADVFDALTTARPYKKAWTVDFAVAEIDRLKGVHFDPQLIEIFHEVLPKILEVKAQFEEPR